MGSLIVKSSFSEKLNLGYKDIPNLRNGTEPFRNLCIPKLRN